MKKASLTNLMVSIALRVGRFEMISVGILTSGLSFLFKKLLVYFMKEVGFLIIVIETFCGSISIIKSKLYLSTLNLIHY